MMENLLGRHFISLCLILLFSIRLASQRSTKDRALRFFWWTVISCLLLVVEDQAESMASLNPDLRFWRILFSIAGYTLRSTATVGLLFVVIRPEGVRKWLWWIPCALNLAVCSTALFTDWCFGYDADYAFYRGPLGFVPFAVPLFYLAVILWETFRRYGKGNRWSEQLILFACAVMCLMSAALDSTRGGVRLHEAIMISSIFFYIFLRSYDMRRDSLTNILNRQSLYDDCAALEKELSAAASLDMNGLKELNNRQGHRAGDEALRQIGECLQEVTDEDRSTYRTGGDEFVILFLKQEEAAVRETLDIVQKSTGEAGISLSCGYAMREENESPESLLLRSEMKMFENKARYYREKQHDRRRERRENPDRRADGFRKSLEDSPQPIAVYSFSDHRVEALAVSDGFCRLFGYRNREQALHILDKDMYTDIHPDDLERYSGAVLRFSGGQEELDVVYRTRAGLEAGWRVVHARGTHLHTESGERIAHVWYMDEGSYIEDGQENGTLITQALNRALHEESILNASHYDELTGLPSLTWFFKLCDARMSEILGEGKKPVLLYMDLNGMKFFNHRYGFTEGDHLLKAFAGTLEKHFGKENSCHIFADRFAACTAEDDPEGNLENRLCALEDEVAGLNGGNSLPVRIGVYSAAENESVSAAFDRAKMACDSIRQTDVSAYRFYCTEMHDAFRKQQYIAANIDRAIREKWIRVYYQPIVRAKDGTLCDEEALARWIDPTEGFLSPADFIPFLEEAGLIYKLDLFVLEEALAKIRSRQEAGLPVVPQSINLSRSDFEGRDIVEEIRRRVDAAGVSHDMISVEITESIIGSSFEYMNAQVKRFRDNGFAVWMDDFGSGYSALDVLQSIEFDLIKFDMSFMRKLDEGENGKIILTELMRMASRLKLDTICEGVEKEEHAAFLREIGCSRLQGYYFGKPAPYEPEK